MAESTASSIMDKQKALTESDIKQIIEDHKVFWISVPIQAPFDGDVRKVGVAVALAGTDCEEDARSNRIMGTSSIFYRLTRVAKWIVPTEIPNVRIDIRRANNYVFYTRNEFRSNTKRYAAGIRILNTGKYNQPFTEDQQKVFDHCADKLKELDCPQNRWKY